MLNEENIKKDYVDPITAAGILKISRSRINLLCREGRFEGAIKTGWSWIIPKIAINNFQRLKRGPKSRKNKNEAFIKEALKIFQESEQNDNSREA